MGRPLLITSYAGLNEQGVTRFVAEQGLGHYVPSTAALLEALRLYEQADPGQGNPQSDRVQDVAARCRALDLKGQTDAVAQAILGYLNRFKPTPYQDVWV